MPILAGIMPVTAVKQRSRFQTLCGCSIPSKLSNLLTADSETSIVERGIVFGVEQVQDLLDNGIEGIHLYTLNKSYSSAAIIAELHKHGYYTTD